MKNYSELTQKEKDAMLTVLMKVKWAVSNDKPVSYDVKEKELLASLTDSLVMEQLTKQNSEVGYAPGID